jgi:hypothetical protein
VFSALPFGPLPPIDPRSSWRYGYDDAPGSDVTVETQFEVRPDGAFVLRRVRYIEPVRHPDSA